MISKQVLGLLCNVVCSHIVMYLPRFLVVEEDSVKYHCPGHLSFGVQRQVLSVMCAACWGQAGQSW